MRRIFSLILLLTVTVISYGPAAHALEIQDVRFGAYPEKTRMVLDVSKVTDFRTFTLSSPYRIVLDLPHFSWQAGKPTKPDETMINDIRQGKLNQNVSRVVFDLKKPIRIENAFLLPAQGGKSNRIVIDYTFASEQQFQKHKGTIHGTLNVETIEEIADKTTASNAIPRPPANSKRPTAASKNTKIKKPLIVIDPGHGGQDPGALSRNKIYEKHIVLALAKEVKRQLMQTGRYRVLLTRERDIYLRLADRVKFARKHEADLFISIHADSIHKPQIRGTSVYTISKKASDKQTARLAEKENQADIMAGLDLDIEDEQVAFILGDFIMNETTNQSKFFANTLVSKLQKQGIKTLQNPHRYAGFAVLKAPDIPSILIEAGFMSNKQEARLLGTKTHRAKIAKAIVNGIDTFFTSQNN